MGIRLLETGDARLLETGDFLLLDLANEPSSDSLLLETGFHRLLETGDFRLLEGEEVVSPFFLGFGLSGKLGNEGEPDPLNVKGIYQMRLTKTGKRPIKMKFYTPTNPQTEAQQANRQKFANAMTSWGALTEAQKDSYTERAKKVGLFGWNLFIREYYQNN